MEANLIQPQIDSINKKLDLILEEIAFQKKHREEIDDLKDDLTRVGKDLYSTALVELEEVHDHIQTGDILHLSKKLLRNVNNLSKMFDQLESARDFVNDASPLFRESIIDLMNNLDEFDRKGYLHFIKELKGVSDNIVTSFSSEDVKNLGENIVTILNTIKNLTQPDMLHAINNAVSVYKNLDIEIEKNVSLFKLIREFNTPEVKRGMAFAMQFLKNIAETQGKS
jgi:uncharacterized protein YjgD (DUF1641 family)